MSDELQFHNLSDRHFGLTPSLSLSYAEAAYICLHRHHDPKVEFRIDDNSKILTATAIRPSVDARMEAAWNNKVDATELGASAIALAAVEHLRGLVAVSRAETATGADYYLDRPESKIVDLETSLRLEISGLDKGSLSQIRYRLAQKILQAQAGNSNLPAIACVVGFEALEIASADVP